MTVKYQKIKNKFDPFDYKNSFYEYELEITEIEINQVLLLVQSRNTLEQKNTYNNLNVLNFPVLKNLKKQVTDILDKKNLFLGNNWAQLYNKKDQHKIHVHGNSCYSGIIYLCNKGSPTLFYDRDFDIYQSQVKKNMLLLFPSWIPHQVEPLKKNENRLIISFNTRKK